MYNHELRVMLTNLLHLEFDGGLHLIYFGDQVLVMGEQRGKLSSLVKAGTQNTRDLLDQGLGGQESIVLLC